MERQYEGDFQDDDQAIPEEAIQGELLVPLEVHRQEVGFSLNVRDMVKDVHEMPLPKFTRFCAQVLPALRIMEKCLRDAAVGRMVMENQTKIPVMSDDGELLGQLVERKTRREYDVNTDMLKHAEQLFHEAGHVDVKLGEEVTMFKNITVAQIRTICRARGGEAAAVAEAAIEQRHVRNSIKVKGFGYQDGESVGQRLKAVHEEINTIVEEGEPLI